MTLCTEDVETACLLDSNSLFLYLCVELIVKLTVKLSCSEDLLVVCISETDSLGDYLLGDLTLSQFCSCEEFSVTAQHDIGTTSCHVGSDGNSAVLTGLSNDLSFLSVLLGVEDFVLDALSLQHSGEELRLLDGNCTNEDRLSFIVTLDDLVDDS